MTTGDTLLSLAPAVSLYRLAALRLASANSPRKARASAAQQLRNHALVPQKIAAELGSGDDLPIHLHVVNARGKVILNEDRILASGTEAYTIEGVEPHARLTVTASRPSGPAAD